MSLKAFHIIFIAVCVVFSLGFGAWGIREYTASGTVSNLIMGIGAFIAAVALVIYGAWFLKKLKNVSYL